MATTQQVERLGMLAIVAGCGLMAMSANVAASSNVAGVATFVTGFAVAGIGILKMVQARKAG